MPNLYKFKDLGFEDFEDFTSYNAEFDDGDERREYFLDDMRWYLAEEGIRAFLGIKAKIAAGESYDLPPATLSKIVEEIKMALKDLEEPAKRKQPFHLAWCE